MNWHQVAVTCAGMATVFVPCAHAQATAGARWPGFRNDGTNCTAAADLPVHWSPSEGIGWQRELPGYGQSTPLLWDGRLYLTAVEGPNKERSLVFALRANSGDTVWKRSIDTTAPAANYRMKSRAAPTPVVDDAGVYAFFEGGDVLALSHDGDELWRRRLNEDYGEFKNGHGLGSSLAQTPDSVIVLIDHAGPGYLLALHKETGETKWKTDRTPRSSWTSPVVATLNGREQVIISSSGTVDGYDANTGTMLWSVDDVGGNSISSATVVGNRVFAGAGAATGGRGEGKAQRASCCIEVSGRDAPSATIAWRAKRAPCHYVSPLVSDGYVYHVNKAGVVACLSAATGETHYQERTAGLCWATPVAAGGHVYVFARGGQTTVLKAGPQFEQVAVNALWDGDAPPAPETYVPSPPESSRRAGPVERLKKADQNGDGVIVKEELPASMQRFFPQVDANDDGKIDGEELEAAATRMRSSSSSDSYDEPMVYGVAAGDGAFFVRTGTRLYCLRDESPTDGPVLEIPSYAADDPRPKSGGFVREVRLAEVERDGTKYILMAWEVGEVLTLGAMTQGPFEGDVDWRLDDAHVRFAVTTEPRSGKVAVVAKHASAGASPLEGRKAGVGDYRWTNVDLPSPLWFARRRGAVSLTFRAKDGAVVTLPQNGSYAARMVAR
ncbi:MAG: PQQ-binding-like beta-propeller repeat protein [Planctomycetota bacterium]